MTSKLVPVTADKVLDLWKAGLVVGPDGHRWLPCGELVGASTLFDCWKDKPHELAMCGAFVVVEDDTSE